MKDVVYFEDLELKPEYDSVCNEVYSNLVAGLDLHQHGEKGRAGNTIDNVVESGYIVLDMIEEAVDNLYRLKQIHDERNPDTELTHDEYNSGIMEKLIIGGLSKYYKSIRANTQYFAFNHPAKIFENYLAGFLGIEEMEE